MSGQATRSQSVLKYLFEFMFCLLVPHCHKGSGYFVEAEVWFPRSVFWVPWKYDHDSSFQYIVRNCLQEKLGDGKFLVGPGFNQFTKNARQIKWVNIKHVAKHHLIKYRFTKLIYDARSQFEKSFPSLPFFKCWEFMMFWKGISSTIRLFPS